MLSLKQKIDHPMKLVIQLAEKGKYTVSPNPMVAAIIIRDGLLQGYGIHMFRGDQHAEAKAIEMAGPNASGSILYINLEPCCHIGLTPPCVEKIIKAQIKQVHFSNIDPNPLMQGKSIEILRNAGIDVFVGEMKQEGELLNNRFFHFQQNKIPFVIAKWAMSLDGKISAKYDSKWITNQISRSKAHLIRNSVDAILVGHNTVLHDNPVLNARSDEVLYKKIPYKIILSNKLDELPKNYNIFTTNPEKTIIVSKKEFSQNQKSFLQNIGAQFFYLEKDNKIDLKSLLIELAKQNISNLLIEGGGYTLSQFLQEKLINYFYCFIGGKIISGENSKTPFSEDIGIDFIKDAHHAKILKTQQFDNDILLEGEINV